MTRLLNGAARSLMILHVVARGIPSAWRSPTTRRSRAALDGTPVPWTVAPMSTNWALPDQYAAIGAELAQLTGGQAVGGPGEVGTLAFHAQVPVLDHFSHRAYTRQYLDKRYRIAGPITRAVLRWNWTHRHDPPIPAVRYQLTYDSSTPRPSGQCCGSGRSATRARHRPARAHRHRAVRSHSTLPRLQ